MNFGLLYLPTYVPELDGSASVFYEHMLEQMVRADELGYDSIWLTEHHFSPYGGLIPNPAVFGTALARATRRIRIGTAVTVLGLHNPLIVAEDFAMLDVLSHGRVDLGVGRGSVQAEFDEFGLTAEDARSVLEATEVIARAWSHDTFSYSGRVFTYSAISLLPRPIQCPRPPIWVGATRSASTFEWAGHDGYHLMVLPYMHPPEFLRERIGLYEDALKLAGHDSPAREIMAKMHVFVADTTEEARRYAAPAYANYQSVSRDRTKRGTAGHWSEGEGYDEHVRASKVISGTPDACIAQIRYWQQTLGITQLGGVFHFGGLSQEATLRSIELFAREVAPAFASSAVLAGERQ